MLPILRGNPTVLLHASDLARAFLTTAILLSLLEQSVNTALATRMANVAEIKQKVLIRRGKDSVLRDKLHVKEVIVGNGERHRRYILCYYPKEAKRQPLFPAQRGRCLQPELSPI